MLDSELIIIFNSITDRWHLVWKSGDCRCKDANRVQTFVMPLKWEMSSRRGARILRQVTEDSGAPLQHNYFLRLIGDTMKRAFIFSAIFSISTPVLAADLSTQPVAAMPYSWTGLYVGAQAGGGWNDSRWDDGFNPVFNTKATGGIFGGQIGYNAQINQFVIGMEGDFAGSNAQGDDVCAGVAGTICGAKQDYLGSLRGRLGYAIDRFLVYEDGGVAFTKYKFTNIAGGAEQSFDTGSRVGWTAGLGAEYAFTDHWTAGFEWNYYDFGSKGAPSDSQPGVFVNFRNTENVVVGKVNYKF